MKSTFQPISYLHYKQVSFLIPSEIIPGRMALLVTLFLVLTTIYGSADNLSPVSTSTNMLALWLIVCIFFVYGALIAYAIILLVRYKLQSEKYVTYYNKWLKVFDLSLLIIFPIFFGIFNFIYWYHVSTISEV